MVKKSEKIYAPWSKRTWRIIDNLIIEVATKYRVGPEELNITVSDDLAQKHAWIAIKTISDLREIIEHRARELKEAEHD